MSDSTKIGFDIGSSSIKMVELAPSGGNKWRLLSAAQSPTPSGSIVGNQNNLSSMVQTISKLYKESGARSKRVVLSIPEEHISSHLVELPYMSDSELESAVEWQVEQYIPIQKEKANWSYQVISKDKNKSLIEILLVAVSKSLASAYMQVFEQAGFEILAIESELSSLSRSLVSSGSPLSLVIDVGHTTTDIGVVLDGSLVFARSMPTAGMAFSRALETSMGLDSSQAEQYRNTYGLNPSQMEGKIAEALKQVLNLIAVEARRTVDFYISKHPDLSVKQVILSGGVAYMPNFATSLSGILGVEVIVGNPFSRIVVNDNLLKQFGSGASAFSVAVGLAMRSV